jgi:hypothetical protein
MKSFIFVPLSICQQPMKSNYVNVGVESSRVGARKKKGRKTDRTAFFDEWIQFSGCSTRSLALRNEKRRNHGSKDETNGSNVFSHDPGGSGHVRCPVAFPVWSNINDADDERRD